MSCQYTYTQHNAQRHITSSSKSPEPQSNQNKASGNAHGESAGQGTVFFKSIMIGKKGRGPDMPGDQEDLTTEPRTWETPAESEHPMIVTANVVSNRFTGATERMQGVAG